MKPYQRAILTGIAKALAFFVKQLPNLTPAAYQKLVAE
jgi:hypothetical protein